MNEAWTEWIGHVAMIKFNGEPAHWPIRLSGWIVIEAVDMPLVLLRSKWGDDDPVWMNANDIKLISQRSEEVDDGH